MIGRKAKGTIKQDQKDQKAKAGIVPNSEQAENHDKWVFEALSKELGEKFRKQFPSHNPVSLLAALEMLTDPKHLKSNYITLLKKQLEHLASQSGEAKLVDPDELMKSKEVEEALKMPLREGEPFSLDNWEHRSKRNSCLSCMWYVPKGKGAMGRCRHNSPTMKGWPAMFPTDWCGCHKLDETKL